MRSQIGANLIPLDPILEKALKSSAKLHLFQTRISRQLAGKLLLVSFKCDTLLILLKNYLETLNSDDYIAYYGCQPIYTNGANWPEELLPYDPEYEQIVLSSVLPDPLEERCEFTGMTRTDPRTNEFLDAEDALFVTACSCAGDLCNDQWPRDIKK